MNDTRPETSGSRCAAVRASDCTIVMPASAAIQRTTPKALVRRVRDATRANASLCNNQN
jgi:ribosomal protein S26